MKIRKATRKYESWLHEELNVFEEDLSLKHQLLAKDPFIFLRGTFYRWMEIFPLVLDFTSSKEYTTHIATS
jgi:hypothetical protein